MLKAEMMHIQQTQAIAKEGHECGRQGLLPRAGAGSYVVGLHIGGVTNATAWFRQVALCLGMMSKLSAIFGTGFGLKFTQAGSVVRFDIC